MKVGRCKALAWAVVIGLQLHVTPSSAADRAAAELVFVGQGSQVVSLPELTLDWRHVGSHGTFTYAAITLTSLSTSRSYGVAYLRATGWRPLLSVPLVGNHPLAVTQIPAGKYRLSIATDARGSMQLGQGQMHRMYDLGESDVHAERRVQTGAALVETEALGRLDKLPRGDFRTLATVAVLTSDSGPVDFHTLNACALADPIPAVWTVRGCGPTTGDEPYTNDDYQPQSARFGLASGMLMALTASRYHRSLQAYTHMGTLVDTVRPQDQLTTFLIALP